MGKKLEFEPALMRVTTEIRFVPTLTSWRNVVGGAMELEQHYKHWRIQDSKSDDVILYSLEDKAVCRLSFNRIMVSVEGTFDASRLFTHSDTLFKEFILKSKIQTINHIGYRVIGGFKTKLQPAELTEIVHEKFHNSSTYKDMPLKVDDLQIVIDGSDKESSLKSHLRFGPMGHQQLWDMFDSPFGGLNHLDEEKAYLFTDIDVYSNGELEVANTLTTQKKAGVLTDAIRNSLLSKLEI